MVKSTIVDVEFEVDLPPVNLINYNRLRFWMSDITMCIGRDCPKKDTCYRFAAPPTWQRQSYFVGVPYKGEGCNYYWKLEEHDENRIGHRDQPST